jgi:hypothetical protein
VGLKLEGIGHVKCYQDNEVEYIFVIVTETVLTTDSMTDSEI